MKQSPACGILGLLAAAHQLLQTTQTILGSPTLVSGGQSSCADSQTTGSDDFSAAKPINAILSPLPRICHGLLCSWSCPCLSAFSMAMLVSRRAAGLARCTARYFSSSTQKHFDVVVVGNGLVGSVSACQIGMMKLAGKHLLTSLACPCSCHLPSAFRCLSWHSKADCQTHGSEYAIS